MHLNISDIPLDLGKVDSQLAGGSGCSRAGYLSLAAKVISVFCCSAAAGDKTNAGDLVSVDDRYVSDLDEWHSGKGSENFLPNV